MAEFEILNDQLQSLKGKVVVITGASSGIGLATVKVLLDLGALVAGGDLNDIPLEHSNLTFVKTDVTSWSSLLNLFESAEKSYGKIDHVFANAGVSGRSTFTDNILDESGRPTEPDLSLLDINLRGVIYTTSLALHYIKKQKEGSIVLTASASSFQQFRVVDYTVAKHGVLGLMRGLVPLLKSKESSIRINSIAPSWTSTGIVPKEAVNSIGVGVQEPVVPARSVACCMADETRQGQLIYSVEGRYMELEHAVMLKSVDETLSRYSKLNEDAVVAALINMQAIANT